MVDNSAFTGSGSIFTKLPLYLRLTRQALLSYSCYSIGLTRRAIPETFGGVPKW